MGVRGSSGRLRSHRDRLVASALVLILSGGVGLEAATLLLTRPAGRLPTLMPGYVAGSLARHNPRYGHDVRDVALSMVGLGVALVVAIFVSALVDRGGDVARATRQFGTPGCFAGLTDGGSEIVLVVGHRLVYRRGGYWRPRVTCPTCERERTSASLKVTCAEDLARLDSPNRRECTSCLRGHRMVLTPDAD
jgi:hypothetical protein